MGHQPLWENMKERERLDAKPEMTEEDGNLAAELELKFAEMNGWEAESNAAKQHIAACNAVYIVTEIIVWTKDDFFVLWETVNHLLGITACHYTIS